MFLMSESASLSRIFPVSLEYSGMMLDCWPAWLLTQRLSADHLSLASWPSHLSRIFGRNVRLAACFRGRFNLG